MLVSSPIILFETMVNGAIVTLSPNVTSPIKTVLTSMVTFCPQVSVPLTSILLGSMIVTPFSVRSSAIFFLLIFSASAKSLFELTPKTSYSEVE